MNLSFKTQFPDGKPTFFIPKIWESLELDSTIKIEYTSNYFTKTGKIIPRNIDSDSTFFPKHHSIREDSYNRWHAGVAIHFYVHTRTPMMFCFAPMLPCKSTQRIFMTIINGLEVSVDSKKLCDIELDALARNDGFENINDFENYFFPHQEDIHAEFSGKIIHWTNLRY